MNSIELHVRYLRHLVHEHIASLLYCKINDHVVDIFMNSLSESKFIKFWDLLKIQETAIMKGCANEISPLESLESCANGGCWNLWL